MIKSVESRAALGRIALASGTVLVAWAGYFGTDQEPKPVNAGVDTPTPTAVPTPTVTRPTPTATPDTRDIERSHLLATATALAKDEENARLRAANEAVRRQIEALLNTPTRIATSTLTPTGIPIRSSAEATATADAIRLEALGKEQARGKATATAQAIQSITPTPTSSPVPTYIAPKESRGGGGEGGFPWGWIGGGFAALAVASLFQKPRRWMARGVGTVVGRVVHALHH